MGSRKSNAMLRGACRTAAWVAVFACFVLEHATVAVAQSASAGFAAIQPSVVQVWALQANGAPIASGTAFVVHSDAQGSELVTAAHVIKGAAAVEIDLSGAEQERATVIDVENDVALLRIGAGNLKAATFAFRKPSIGDTIAAVGFYRIEQGGRAARLLFPGTVSATLSDGRLIQFDNLNILEGLSGGPIFDPTTGAVSGMIVSRATDGIGGTAISAANFLLAVLRAKDIKVAIEANPRAAPVVAAAAPARLLKGPGKSPGDAWLEYPFPGLFWRRDGCTPVSTTTGTGAIYGAKFYNDYRVPITFEFGLHAQNDDRITWHPAVRVASGETSPTYPVVVQGLYCNNAVRSLRNVRFDVKSDP